MKNSFAEQRSQGRLLTQVKVVYTPNAENPIDSKLQCQSSDLSLEGICLHSGDALPLGTRGLLEVDINPSKNSYNHLARVIWCRQTSDGYLIGLQIIEHLCDKMSWKKAVIDILVG